MYSHYTYRKAYFDVREDGGQSEEDRIQAMIKRSDARNQHLQAQIKSYEKSIQDSEKETEEIRRMIENGTENSLYGKSLHNIHDYRDVNEPEKNISIWATPQEEVTTIRLLAQYNLFLSYNKTGNNITVEPISIDSWLHYYSEWKDYLITMLGSGIPIRSSLIAIENWELIVLKIDGKGYSIPRENFYNREEMLKNGHWKKKS